MDNISFVNDSCQKKDIPVLVLELWKFKDYHFPLNRFVAAKVIHLALTSGVRLVCSIKCLRGLPLGSNIITVVAWSFSTRYRVSILNCSRCCKLSSCFQNTVSAIKSKQVLLTFELVPFVGWEGICCDISSQSPSSNQASCFSYATLNSFY